MKKDQKEEQSMQMGIVVFKHKEMLYSSRNTSSSPFRSPGTSWGSGGGYERLASL